MVCLLVNILEIAPFPLLTCLASFTQHHAASGARPRCHVYWCVPACTDVYLHVPACIRVYPRVSACVRVYPCVCRSSVHCMHVPWGLCPGFSGWVCGLLSVRSPSTSGGCGHSPASLSGTFACIFSGVWRSGIVESGGWGRFKTTYEKLLNSFPK